MEIGAGGNASTKFPSGAELAALAVWEGTALSSAQLTSLFEAKRDEFGI
jgi:hypothetical protein